ncbi:MAG TPA: hypothetical protein VIM58_04655 [Candidatus Methylacidiphilales bacterium]
MAEESFIVPFELRVDFERFSTHPSRVFHAMSDLIDGFESFDRTLLYPFSLRVDPTLVLEDIKAGSIRSVLATVLRSTNDEAIKNLDWKKLIGSYLLDSKYWLLKHLEDKPEIRTRAELLEITDKINDLAKGTDILRLPSYKAISSSKILDVTKYIAKSVEPLTPGDSAQFEAAGQIVEINTSFIHNKDTEEDLLTSTTNTFVSEERLKVKKPDYLGNSQWQFRHKKHLILAFMDDHDWLLQFQSKRVDLEPGDALHLLLETKQNLDDDGLIIATHYRVTKVLGVIQSRTEPGDDLFEKWE